MVFIKFRRVDESKNRVAFLVPDSNFWGAIAKTQNDSNENLENVYTSKLKEPIFVIVQPHYRNVVQIVLKFHDFKLKIKSFMKP